MKQKSILAFLVAISLIFFEYSCTRKDHLSISVLEEKMLLSWNDEFQRYDSLIRPESERLKFRFYREKDEFKQCICGNIVQLLIGDKVVFQSDPRRNFYSTEVNPCGSSFRNVLVWKDEKKYVGYIESNDPLGQIHFYSKDILNSNSHPDSCSVFLIMDWAN